MGMEKFKASQFVGKEVICHIEFIPYLKLMNSKAKDLGLKIHVTSSDRNSSNVKGAIVEPSKMSNHMVGHAIDCNIIDGKEWWNSKKLENPTGNVLKFIEYCESIGLRWGGRWKTPDTVHFDYPLNIVDSKKWREIFNNK